MSNRTSVTTGPKGMGVLPKDQNHLPPFPREASLKLEKWERKSQPSRLNAAQIPGRPIIQHTWSRLNNNQSRKVAAAAKSGGTTAQGKEPDSPITAYMKEELQVRDLNDMHIHLWWAGRPGNIHCLHDQKILHRTVLVTERTRLHLTWADDTIYIKPLPASLLNYDFWEKHICGDQELRELALGFLKSYTKLLQYPIDVHMAKELHLIPDHLDWEKWNILAAEVLDRLLAEGDVTNLVNKRYHYGELRLGRLNHIAIFCRGKYMRMYHRQYTTYDQFFSKNFAWMLLLVVYLSVVLTAMQVVMSAPDASQKAIDVSYWFSIASMLVVAGVSGIQLLVFMGLFVVYFWQTCVHLKKKGVESVWSTQRKQDPGNRV